MHLSTIVFLGLAANLDNLCIGMSYGLMGKRIKPLHNLIVSLISGAFAYIACAAAGLFSGYQSGVPMLIGSILLIGMGLYTVWDGIRKRGAEQQVEEDALRDTRLSEVCLLGVALAINCLASAFGAGLTNVSAAGLALSVALFSCAAVWLGNLLGGRVKWLCRSHWLDTASGAMLVLIGIWELFI